MKPEEKMRELVDKWKDEYRKVKDLPGCMVSWIVDEPLWWRITIFMNENDDEGNDSDWCIDAMREVNNE